LLLKYILLPDQLSHRRTAGDSYVLFFRCGEGMERLRSGK